MNHSEATKVCDVFHLLGHEANLLYNGNTEDYQLIVDGGWRLDPLADLVDLLRAQLVRVEVVYDDHEEDWDLRARQAEDTLFGRFF